MRIAILTGEYPPMQGGVGAYTAILAHTLSAQGQEVHILTSSPAQTTEIEGVSVTATIHGWGFRSLPLIRRWLETVRPDVINIQYQTAAFNMSGLIHFLPCLLRPYPVVTTFHDLRAPYLFPKAGRVRDWIVMHLARTSAGVIVTNHEDEAQLDQLPLHRLVPIGSNILTTAPSDVSYYRHAAGISDHEYLIVYFGLINRSKGIDTLLKAVRLLLDEGLPVRLALVGAVAGASDPTNIAMIQEIEVLIKTLALDAIIHRTPYLQDADVAGYLAAADVVALPFTDGASYRRGSLMAAIRMGCAIVTTIPRFSVPTFRDGVNLSLTPPNDSGALAGALWTILQNGSLRKQLHIGAKALATAFEWDPIARETTHFFNRILKAKP